MTEPADQLSGMKTVQGLDLHEADEARIWQWLNLQSYLWMQRASCPCGALFLYYCQSNLATESSQMRCFCGNWITVFGYHPVFVGGLRQ